jgi:hypothetical protein
MSATDKIQYDIRQATELLATCHNQKDWDAARLVCIELARLYKLLWLETK